MEIDRRILLSGVATGAAMLAPGSSLAPSGDAAKLGAAIAAGHDASIARLREWIALPSIAAE